MSDERIEANLAAYIDGVLSPEDRASIERLLAENPRHRRMVQEMQRAQALLATLPTVQAPADLADGVDPGLERSALLGEDESDRGILARLMAPQVLALAATLVLLLSLLATAVYLVPSDGGRELAGGPEPEPRDVDTGVVPTPPDSGEPDGPAEDSGVAPLVGTLPGVEETGSTEPADETEGTAPDGDDAEGTETPLEPDGMADDQERPEVPEGALPDTDDPVDNVTEPAPPDPRVLMLAREMAEEDALVLRAEVGSLPDASGLVAQFLTAAEVPISGQRVELVDLPESLRNALGEIDSDEVQLYVVDSLPQKQSRALLETLAGVGRPVLIDSPSSGREDSTRDESLRIAEPQTAQDESRQGIDVDKQRQAMRIFPRDELSFVITRDGDVPELPTPGIPHLRDKTHFKLEVSDDGYIDLGAVGLGRTDVLGRDPDALEEIIRKRLAEDYRIGATVHVFHADRADIPAGRTDQEIEYLVVDREPVTPGTMLRITLEDGGVVDTVVGTDGTAAAGALGDIDTTDQSVTELQRTLREAAKEATTQPEPTSQPLLGGGSKRNISVTNLSVRRNVAEVGEANRPLVIILTPSPGAAGDWEGLSLDPATRPTTGPTTVPSTVPTTAPGL